jgi:hypothetical protein
MCWGRVVPIGPVLLGRGLVCWMYASWPHGRALGQRCGGRSRGLAQPGPGRGRAIDRHRWPRSDGGRGRGPHRAVRPESARGGAAAARMVGVRASVPQSADLHPARGTRHHDRSGSVRRRVGDRGGARLERGDRIHAGAQGRGRGPGVDAAGGPSRPGRSRRARSRDRQQGSGSRRRGAAGVRCAHPG